LAASTDIPAWVFRAAFIVLLITGVAPLLYAALWICMPLEPAAHESQFAANPPEPSPAQ
jgi:phage shock protein PspC (stress-responsive transcriptional regulator)